VDDIEICRLEHVSKVYYSAEDVCPIDDVSLAISQGDFIGIEGPSGMGKSTLLYLMGGGLLRPTRGSLWLSGKDTSKLSDRELTSLRAKTIGFIFQETSLFPALTALENVEMAMFLSKRSRLTQVEKEHALALLTDLGLKERAVFLPHQLSIGQRRRVVVCRAIVNRPSLILADEPTNDLDPVWAGKVIDLLESSVQEGGAVVMVNHSGWANRAYQRYRLEAGKLISA